jgi:hypothetical protein
MNIEIDNKIIELFKIRVESNDEFSSVEEYVNFVLDQVAERLKDELKSDNSYSEEDEKKVKERLRSLGYLD